MDLSESNLIEITNWQSVRDYVYKVNKPLAIIIDEFNPNTNYPLIRVRYPYGFLIRQNGKLQLPKSMETYCDLSHHPDRNMQKYLSYSPSPIGLVLNKVVEVYIEMPEGRTIPFKLFNPGVCFGVWEILPTSPIMLRQGWEWSISSGARTIFMLPKIADAISHSRLQHAFNLKSHLPNSLFEEHKIFKEITCSKQNNAGWYTEVLFFTHKWLEEHPKNIGWIKLKEYWAKEAWQQMLYWSNRIYLDYNWEKFTTELIYRKIVLKPYLLDTLRHLIAIGCNTIPGFKLADRDNTVAPITHIQDAYLNIYDLKSYAPIMMYADMLLSNNDTNTYYSLQAPTLPVKPPEWKEIPSAMKSLRELKTYIDIFIQIFSEWPRTNISQVIDFIDNIKFSYFHSDSDKYNIIQTTKTLFQKDKTFAEQMKFFPTKIFPETSPFLRGCIKVELNKNTDKK